MISWLRSTFFFLILLYPSWAFVEDFEKLSSAQKDQFFSYVKNQVTPMASLAQLQKTAYPYPLKSVRDSVGTTLIHYAVSQNLPSIVTLLQKQGLSLDTKTTAGIPPIQIAIFRENLPMIQFLLDHGANINIQNNNGQTPLMVATIIGNKDIVSYLLSRHAKINMRDNNGLNVLTQAVSDNNTELSLLFIDAGVDVNARTTFNRTPLHFAVQNNNYEIVQKLLDSGASVNPRDYDFQTPNTPFDLLSEQSSSVNISQDTEKIRALLLEHGAKKAKPYYNNNFSLSAVYSFGSPFNVKALGLNTEAPVQIQYTGLNLRYYLTPELSLSWTYAYGISLAHRNYGFFMAPGGLMGLQDLFSFLQTDYKSQLHGPASGLYYSLIGLSAILPEGISWDIHIPTIPYMSFSVEVDWARAHYIFSTDTNKPFSMELTGEIQGRLNLLFGEHFLMGFNLNVGVSYTQLDFVWGLGLSLGALF